AFGMYTKLSAVATVAPMQPTMNNSRHDELANAPPATGPSAGDSITIIMNEAYAFGRRAASNAPWMTANVAGVMIPALAPWRARLASNTSSDCAEAASADAPANATRQTVNTDRTSNRSTSQPD